MNRSDGRRTRLGGPPRLAWVSLLASAFGVGLLLLADQLVTPAARPPVAAGRASADRRQAAPSPIARPVPVTVLVRSVGDLPPGTAGRVATVPGVEAVAVVRSGTALLTGDDARGRRVTRLAPGWALPLDVAGIDPVRYAALLPQPAGSRLARLGPGEVLLGSTSARVRGLGPGSVLSFGGRRLRVAGIVDDALVGAAEAVATAAQADGLGIRGASYVLAGGGIPGPELRRRVADALAGVSGVLVRELGRAPWPVTWREVLPQALVKDRFGEFAVRLRGGRMVQLEPGWQRAQIVTGAVPLLGRVRCHRMMLPALRAALTELQRRHLGRLVDSGDFAGCFSPRLIAPGAGVSRHAWGIAVDLNASRNPYGARSRQDPRLVELMERHGFAFGGRWPVPDAMHFEYRAGDRLADVHADARSTRRRGAVAGHGHAASVRGTSADRS